MNFHVRPGFCWIYRCTAYTPLVNKRTKKRGGRRGGEGVPWGYNHRTFGHGQNWFNFDSGVCVPACVGIIIYTFGVGEMTEWENGSMHCCRISIEMAFFGYAILLGLVCTIVIHIAYKLGWRSKCIHSYKFTTISSESFNMFNMSIEHHVKSSESSYVD